MTTFTIYPDTNDASIKCSSTVYADARSGAGTLTVAPATDSTGAVGQQLVSTTYSVMELFQQYDTSGIGAGAVITAGTLSFGMPGVDSSVTDFDIDAYSHDWGGGAVTTGDFIAGADFAAMTRIGTRNTAGLALSSQGGANVLTSDAEMLTEINKTGFTRVVMVSRKTSANTAPTGDEYISIRMADNTGTINDPRLTVVATLPIAGTLSQTEADDTVSAAAKVALKGVLAQTEADDTLGAAIFTVSLGEISVKHGGVWKVPTTYVKYDGVWIEPIAGYVKDAGTWQRVL